jgi:hypothetical protein
MGLSAAPGASGNSEKKYCIFNPEALTHEHVLWDGSLLADLPQTIGAGSYGTPALSISTAISKFLRLGGRADFA